MGRLRLFNAPPHLAALLRAAEVVHTLRRARDIWAGPAATLDDSAATLEALIDAPASEWPGEWPGESDAESPGSAIRPH